MKRIFYFLLLGSLLTVISCSAPEKPEFRKLENVKFKSASIKDMKVTLTGDAVLFNPNALGANISGMDFDIFANGKKVTKVRQEITATIPANNTFKLPLEFDIPVKEVFKDFKPTITNIFNKKKLNYKVDGHLIVNLAGANIKVPVTHEDEEEIKFF